MRSHYDKLNRISAPEQPLAPRKVIVICEKGQKYRLELSESRESAVFKIDKGLICDELNPKCDKLILLSSAEAGQGLRQIFVELKGRNIGHAVEQLGLTIDNQLFKHSDFDKKKNVFARIVGTRIPAKSRDPYFEAKKRAFIHKHGNILKILSSGCPDQMP